MKLCKDCKHAHNHDDYIMCHKPEWTTKGHVDVVLGHKWPDHYQHCADLRASECGADAVGFEPRLPSQRDVMKNEIVFAYGRTYVTKKPWYHF